MLVRERSLFVYKLSCDLIIFMCSADGYMKCTVCQGEDPTF